MPLEAFNSSASIINVLTGGVNSVGRSLLLGQQDIQTNAVRSIEESFASRIDESIARLNQTDTSPKISSLRREQSILVSRKERLNQAIELLNKTLTQTKLIKIALNHLQDILDGLQDNSTESETSAVARDWDNTLRKINVLVEGATVTYKDGGVSYEVNLIKPDGSRTDFPKNRPLFSSDDPPETLSPHVHRSFLAPFNSNGDTLLINGTYLGTDYFLQPTSGAFGGNFNNLSAGTIWNSDTAFRDTEEETGTLTEFTLVGDPGKPSLGSATGASGPVNDPHKFTNQSKEILWNESIRNLTSPSTHVGKDVLFWFDNFDGGSFLPTSAEVKTGGLGLLDAWVYNDFSATRFFVVDGVNSTLGTREQAIDDLGVKFLVNSTAKTSKQGAMSKVVLAEKQFQHALDTLQSRANLFDPQIAGIEKEISDITATSLSEKEAIVSSLKLASQVAQFQLAILASRGSTIVSSLILSQDNFNGLGSSFKATGDALLGATLSIQV